MAIRSLTCACCGRDAGRFEQWWNQDTGYGLCGACATWIADRGMSAEDLDRTYGKAGTHRPQAEPKDEVHT